MERDINNNTTSQTHYRHITHNETRIKILEKEFIRLSYKGKRYIVPRAGETIATMESFDLCEGALEQYTSDNNPTLYIVENDKNQLSISCTFSQYVTECECENISLSIFRQGDYEPLLEKRLSIVDDEYFFVEKNDNLTIPSVGNYIAIVSGVSHLEGRYNHQQGYAIIPFTIAERSIKERKIVAVQCDTTSIKTGSREALNLYLKYPSSSSKLETIEMMCFDSEMIVAAHHPIVLQPHKRNELCCIEIKPTLFWIENEQYTILLSNSFGVQHTITFTLGSNNSPTICHKHQVEELYSNAFEILHNSKATELAIERVAGMSQMRQQMFRLYSHRKEIEKINAISNACLPTSQHMIVIKGEMDYHSRVLSAPNILSKIVTNQVATITSPDALTTNDDEEDNDDLAIFSDNNVTISIWQQLDLICNNRNKWLNEIIKYINSDKFMILYDEERAIKRFFATFPELKCFFSPDYTFRCCAPSIKEVAYHLFRKCKEVCQFDASSCSISFIYDYLSKCVEQGNSISKWFDDNTCKMLFLRAKQQMRNRITKGLAHGKDHLQEVIEIEPQDIDFSQFSTPRQELDIAISDLNNMVGLDNIKREIETLATQMQFAQHRARLGFAPEQKGCHHMIFTGNPGTGKTTVAKMIGRIFHSLNLLSKGEVIVTERSKLIGRYIGETEDNVRDILKEAKGNVLFIDEAYTLCKSENDDRDFGRHAIEALLTTLADENADMLVIMAGYEKEMNKMMDINTGLKGRFPHQWHFKDYNAEQLMSIALNTFAHEHYILSPDAHEALRRAIECTLQRGDAHFSNARWIKQQVTHAILPAMAKRVMQHDPSEINATLLCTIEASDISAIETTSNNKTTSRAPIGFCANHLTNVA